MASTTPNPLPDPTAPEDHPEGMEYAVALAIVVLSVGLLVVAFAVWKIRRKKLVSQPVPDPQTLKGGSNE
jgi:hypothetical protein